MIELDMPFDERREVKWHIFSQFVWDNIFCSHRFFCLRKNFGLKLNPLIVLRRSTSWWFMMTVSQQLQIQKVPLFRTLVKSVCTCLMLRCFMKKPELLLAFEIPSPSNTKCCFKIKNSFKNAARQLWQQLKIAWDGSSPTMTVQQLNPISTITNPKSCQADRTFRSLYIMKKYLIPDLHLPAPRQWSQVVRLLCVVGRRRQIIWDHSWRPLPAAPAALLPNHLFRP